MRIQGCSSRETRIRLLPPGIHLIAAALLFAPVSCNLNGDSGLSREHAVLALETLIDDRTLDEYVHFEVLSDSHLAVESGRVGFRIMDRQKRLNNGVRSEIAIDYPFVSGDVVTYGWDVMTGDPFAHDAPENRWWVVGQWHDQPDPALGETWDGFPSNSPPVAFYFGHLDGKNYLQPHYPGYGMTEADLILLPDGQWTSLSVSILWSTADEGSMSISVNGEPVGHRLYRGPNMLNNYQHYLKLGMYRHPDIPGEALMWFRNLSIK